MTPADDLGPYPVEVEPTDPLVRADRGFKVGAGIGVLAAVLSIGLLRNGPGDIVQTFLGIAALGALVAGLVFTASPGTRRAGTIIITAVVVAVLVTFGAVYALWTLAFAAT